MGRDRVGSTHLLVPIEVFLQHHLAAKVRNGCTVVGRARRLALRDVELLEHGGVRRLELQHGRTHALTRCMDGGWGCLRAEAQRRVGGQTSA